MTEQRVTAQEEFDAVYITSSEICKMLKINRASLVQRRRQGLLPDPITINGAQITIWKRETIQPSLDAWQTMLQARRGNLAA